MTRSRLHIYLAGAGGSVAGRGAELACGLASIWLLNRILSVDEYGRFVLAMTILTLALPLAGAGLDRTLLLRAARLDALPGELAGRELAGAALGASLIGGAITLVAVALAAGPIGRLFDAPGLTLWLALLAVLIPIQAGVRVHDAWYRGRQRVGEAALRAQALPALLTLLGLLAAWALRPSPDGVAAAYAGAHTLALAGWWQGARARPSDPRHVFTRPDLRYGLALSGAELLRRANRGSDLLLLGLLAGAATTGEYRVAARLAAIAVVVHEVLGSVLGPRIGQLLAARQRETLGAEYARVRGLSLAAALAVALVAVLAGRPLLAAFGPFEDAWPVLLLLIAAYTVPVAFGTNGQALRMAGHGTAALGVQLLLLLANLALLSLCVPRWGATGAAIAIGLALLAANLVTSLLLLRRERLRTLSPGIVAIAGMAIAALGLGACGGLPAGGVAAVLAAATLAAARAGTRDRDTRPGQAPRATTVTP